jgi:hypothetical protein
MRGWVLSLFVMLVGAAGQAAKEENAMVSTSPITLQAGELTATFADNEAYGEFHKQKYNGISELRHTSATDNLFVPDYAGFNLEHFFGGDIVDPLFEPRLEPMFLSQVDDRTVRLHQPPTSLSKVESLTVFRLAPPHAIDVEVEVIFHDLKRFRHGYGGIFWASYINEPEDRHIYFWGTCPDMSEPHWIDAFSEKHGVKSTHLFVGDKFDAYFAPDFNATLASHFSGYRYVEPFYYGRRGDMVYAIFFDRTEGIRFSQSPTGGGNENPAWDHQSIVPDPEIGKPYTYNARLIYKPWESAEDIRQEFQGWWKEPGKE